MLALDFIKANRETVESAIRDKGVDLDLDHLLALDTQVRAAKTEIELDILVADGALDRLAVRLDEIHCQHRCGA